MSFEAELKKFELSSVFTINFSWLKRYVESDNGMYTPMKNISDDEFREIENSLYALQATWKAWREAKTQAVPKWISVKDNLPPANILVLGMSQTRSNIFNIYNVMALDEFEEVDVTHWMPLPDAPQEPTND